MEDGVYITYTPPGGADSVTKKLGSGSLKRTMIIDNVYVRFSNGETSANVKLYTDNWAALTNDNFAMEVKVTSSGSINKAIAADGVFPTYDITPTYNYNASTGVLSVTGGYTDKGGGAGLSRSMAATVTVFLLEVE